MNRKQLLLVLAALVIVGSAGLVLIKQHRESWSVATAKMGDKVLTDFHPNDVAAMRIKDSSGEINLVHKNDAWRVRERDDYPANFGRISDLLIRLQGLKVVEAETVGPSQLGRVNLDEPGAPGTGGTLVEFKDSQGKVLTALLLGKKHAREQGESSHSVVAAEPDGRYILLRSNPTDVLLISDALASLAPQPEIWLSKEFFKAEKPKSIALAATNDVYSWQLTRKTELSPWMLVDSKPGESLDTNKASRIAKVADSITFADVASAKDAGETGLDQAPTVVIETFDNFVYTLKAARGGESHCYVTVAVTANIPTERLAGRNEKPDDRKKLDQEFNEQAKKLREKLRQEQALASWVYVLNSWILDPLVQNRAEILQGYMDEKVAESAKAAEEAAAKKKAGWTPHVIQ